MIRKLRVLTAIPFACAIAYAVAVTFAGDARTVAIRVGIEVAKTLAMVGPLLAALALRKGDHLRRAWIYLAVSAAFLLLRDLMLFQPLIDLAPAAAPWVRAGLACVANVHGVLGTWLLANAWSIAGVELPGTHLSRRGWMLIAAVVALILIGPPTWLRLQEAQTGNARAVAMIVSGLADGIQLTLLAPVILTAAALRGGLLSWIWGFYAASQLSWLLYDAFSAYGELTAHGNLALLTAGDSVRVLALALCFSAGVAQRGVVLSARRAL
jgi:hypothetical protein